MKKLLLMFSVILSLFGDEVQDTYYKSYNYEKMGDYKDAIKVLIPIYNKYKNGYTLNLRLGYLFYLSKKYENGIKHYKIASLILPYSIEPKLGLMKIYLDKGQFDDALKIGNTILKIDYYNYYANYYEVLALKGKGENKVAIDITNKMLTIYPTSVLYLNILGELYYKNNPKQAKEIFKNVLILDPNNVLAKSYLKK